ncbi:methylmalonyl-CoA epimerase [uncultured Friedmanniella sp.]|uniref:methylmalonyl-CoA epimerase n=1 Tax=uncultured Friedmanniella sp. TaxID=335381 RepID=UPI0035CC2CF9
MNAAGSEPAAGSGPAADLGLADGGLLRAVDHVGLAVADLDAAIAFHTEVLGLVLVHREENADADVAEAMLAVPGVEGGTQVQLLAALTPESPIARFLDRSGPGLQQLAYEVSDVVLAASRLRERGLRLLYDQPRPGTRGSLVNFVHPHDTGGVLVELVEPAPVPVAAGEDSP